MRENGEMCIVLCVHWKNCFKTRKKQCDVRPSESDASRPLHSFHFRHLFDDFCCVVLAIVIADLRGDSNGGGQ